MKKKFNLSEITLDVAEDALKEFVDKPVYRTNSVARIIDVVAKYYGIDSSMIKGNPEFIMIDEQKVAYEEILRISTGS